MAALAETRDVGSWLPLPASVRRLCCLGDSITYGQGVAPRQTLASHIVRFANMIYPDQLVWVDNRGQSSGNIWHSWVPFERLSADIRFDAAIFSICQNDSQIFESNSVRYPGGDPAVWLTDGKLKPLLHETIVEMARVAGERGLCLILDFYSRWDRDAPLVAAVAEECRAAGLPFVDLLQFLNEESGVSVADFVASPFDGHPSDAGHRAAARRIVEELREHWQPASPEGPPVAEQLVAACDQAARDGWSPDDVFHWAFLVLDAKDVVARRRRARTGAVSLGDLAAARTAITERYRHWHEVRGAAVQTRLLYQRRNDLWMSLEGAYSSIRNLDEIAFVLERSHAGTTSSELWQLLAEGGYYNAADRLQKLPGDLRAQLLSMAATAMPTVDGLGPILGEFNRLRHDFDRNLKRLASLLPEKLGASSLDHDTRRLWEVAYYLVNASWTYVLQFAQALSTMAVRQPEQPVFFTTVDVRVERDTSRPRTTGRYNLTVEVDYVEPRRSRSRYKLWAGAEQDTYVYRFEMPLLFLGDVGVGVPQWDNLHRLFLDGELRLARVEISNFPTGGPRSKDAFVWQPPLTADPVHWLKLPDLRVPDYTPDKSWKSLILGA